MSSPVAAQRLVGGTDTYEVIPASRVIRVHDAEQARDLLARTHERDALGGTMAPDLDEVARQIARGEMLLVRRHALRPLDPPDPNAVPLLSDLTDPLVGGDPISLEPTQAAQTWFELVVVDGQERPLAGVDVILDVDGQHEKLTTDGDGKIRFEEATSTGASVRIPASAELRDALGPAWEQTDDAALPEAGDKLDVAVFRGEEMGPVRLRAKTPHTVSVQPHVALGQLEGEPFAPQRDFLLPHGAAGLLELIGKPGEDAELVIVTHASGEDAQAVSDDRAARIQEFLDGDVDAWVARYGDDAPEARRWGAAEDQWMLRALPDWGERDPATDAVEWFQDSRGLDVDGIAGPKTRTALIEEYMRCDSVSLPGAIMALGAGEAFFEEGEPCGPDAVEFLSFTDGLGVQPPASDAIDAAVYASWHGRVRTKQRVAANLSDFAPVVPILQAEDIHFGNERVVFLPAPPRDPDLAKGEQPEDSVTGLSLARAVLQYGVLNPDKKIAFVGHADALGSTDTNLTVSRDRAENVKLFIMGERETWAEHCIGHYAVDDVQNILEWAAHTWGWETLPGKIDNEMGDITQGALNEYRIAYNAEFDADIPEDGDITAADFEAFYDLLEATLEEMLAEGAPSLEEMREPIGLLGGGEPADEEAGVIACGEAWAHEPIVMKDYPEGSERRVDVMFFDPSDAALANAEAEPPLSEIYGSPLTIARPLSADPVPFGRLDYEVWAALRSHWVDLPVGGVQYELVGPFPTQAVVREGMADENGHLQERNLLAGSYELIIEDQRIPVEARIMDHHPPGLTEPSHLRMPERDGEVRPTHLNPEAQPGEWIVPAAEASDDEDDHDMWAEDGADDEA